MAIIENGKIYRNLQEQVFENTKDIEELQQNTSIEATRNLINQTYGIQDQDGATVINRQFIVKSQIAPLVYIAGITNIGGDLYLNGKIQIGNTAITEEQLQKLLQLIQV